MTQLNSNVLIGLFVVIILFAVIYYLNQNDDQPIHNDGTVQPHMDFERGGNFPRNLKGGNARPANPPMIDNRKANDVSDSLVDDLIAQYSVEDRPIDGGGNGSFTACDPMADKHGPFSGYGKKRQLNFRQIEKPYSDAEYDARDFSYKKKKFTKRTPDDVKELFNINKMLPQEVEEDWFDVEPLLTTKKIKGTHLIHPKVHMGVNTVGSSLRYGTHDIRGDVACPKILVSPWLNSTIEPDTNLKGICNPI